MIIAYIDTRPFIGVALVPVAAVLGLLLSRFILPSVPKFVCQLCSFTLIIAVYQFILYGPLIDKKRIVSVRAQVTWKPERGPDVVAFTFPAGFGFGGIESKDIDVANRIRKRDMKEMDISVELTYDFGSVRGMNLMFAYADGILFAPNTE